LNLEVVSFEVAFGGLGQEAGAAELQCNCAHHTRGRTGQLDGRWRVVAVVAVLVVMLVNSDHIDRYFVPSATAAATATAVLLSLHTTSQS